MKMQVKSNGTNAVVNQSSSELGHSWVWYQAPFSDSYLVRNNVKNVVYYGVMNGGPVVVRAFCAV